MGFRPAGMDSPKPPLSRKSRLVCGFCGAEIPEDVIDPIDLDLGDESLLAVDPANAQVGRRLIVRVRAACAVPPVLCSGKGAKVGAATVKAVAVDMIDVTLRVRLVQNLPVQNESAAARFAPNRIHSSAGPHVSAPLERGKVSIASVNDSDVTLRQ
jgi:hypothetical protein